jgi:hypothetical protein
LRARVFLKDEVGEYRLAAEFEAQDADNVWRQIEAEPDIAGRRMAPGDIVYIGDVYLQLDGDGGWRPVRPGKLTRQLYGLIT